jgi:hypothetical protein
LEDDAIGSVRYRAPIRIIAGYSEEVTCIDTPEAPGVGVTKDHPAGAVYFILKVALE